MKIVIQDASVLIDMADCDLLDAWFGLGFGGGRWKANNASLNTQGRTKSFVSRNDATTQRKAFKQSDGFWF